MALVKEDYTEIMSTDEHSASLLTLTTASSPTVSSSELPVTPLHTAPRSAVTQSPPATPVTPNGDGIVPRIVYTPLRTSYSQQSSPVFESPSSRTKLLSTRSSQWASEAAARVTKTLKRAASFASFGERTGNGDEVHVQQSLPRRMSEDAAAAAAAAARERFDGGEEVKAITVGTTMAASDTVLPPLRTPLLSSSSSSASESTFTSLLLSSPLPSPSPTESSSQPQSSAASAQLRASVITTGSELSAQWFQSPRERLGLYLTVTKRGYAPWEHRVTRENKAHGEIYHGKTSETRGKRGWRRFLLGKSLSLRWAKVGPEES